jgi:hypothetical protein
MDGAHPALVLSMYVWMLAYSGYTAGAIHPTIIAVVERKLKGDLTEGHLHAR